MPLLFDAFNLFSRKSRLASCAVSLASVSAAPAPKTPSSSPSTSGPSTLEVIAALEEPEVCTIHVEVGAGSECRESMAGSAGTTGAQGTTRKSPRSPRRPAARHALLKCTMSPPSSKDPTRTLRRSSISVSQVSNSTSSGHRRKRSSSTSSIADTCVVVAFPTSGEGENDSTARSTSNSEVGEGWIVGGASEDTRPPRKRARRSAVSTSRPASSSPTRSRCKQERYLSSSLGLNDSCSSPSNLSPTSPHPESPPSPRPSLRTRSPSPPVNPRTNFTRQQRDLASVYHTLVMHHEITIPAALDEQRALRDLQAVPGGSALGLEMKSYLGKFDEAVQEELQELDGMLLTRIYLRLLLSRVPVAPLEHDRLRRTKEWDGHGVESDLVLDSPPGLKSKGTVGTTSESGVADVREDRIIEESPWICLEDSMDIDDAGPQPSSSTSSPSSPSPPEDSSLSTPEVPQWVGPPYPSLSALVVDLILRYRHRAALESRRKRNRPRVSKSSTKSRLGLASFTLGDLVKEEGKRRSMDEGRRMDEALDGMPMCMMDAESMDVDKLPESAVRSTFGWSEPDEEEAEFGREEVQPPFDDKSSPSEPSHPVCVDGDADFDSDSDDDMEWKRLRIELVAGPSSDPSPAPSQPIPIRPPSPIPHQLDDDDISPPAILHEEKTPLGVRRRPIKDVTNTPPIARSRKTSSSRSGRIQKSPASSRKPVPKIRYPEHALAGSK